MNNKGFNVSELTPVQLERMQEVYVCPSFACNLNCSHCFLKNLPINTEWDTLFSSIEYLNNNAGPHLVFDLFGGEPLILDKNRFSEIMSLFKGREYIISSNLINYSEFYLSYLKDASLVNTSWNPSRFSVEQYNNWRNTVSFLTSNGVRVAIMITLTKDLISQEESPGLITKMLGELKASSADFDYLIGKGYPEPEVVDNYLNAIFDKFKENCPDCIFTKVQKMRTAVKEGRKFKDCSNFYTLLPTGKIKRGCAYCENLKVREECKYCEYYDICNGSCPLTEACSFPKKLFERIRNEEAC